MRARLMGRTARLGQEPAEWAGRAGRTIVRYDELLAAAATVADERARGEILAWAGRADVPGSPAERYAAALADLRGAERAGADAVYGADLARARVGQLEEEVRELEARVSNAIEAYGALPAAEAAGGMPDAAGMCVLGAIGALGLVIIPLVWS